ncbi:MAG: maltose alpha-D-glucosyltransferase [Candidatus Binataceae bacterium]|nr:maltose alpha-D-glucosyltransferase [Candidatus Binataceae bacterium]
MNHNRILADDPTWYKDAIFYEVRVRSFFDSSGDGVGDFPGLTARLDYLRDLGVTALWLLPFYPSPLRDDGYDISDYMQVHPDCGTLHDFKIFLREAHRRGLRVVTELVLNHTSDQHPWFQRARRAPPGDPARDFYVWSDTTDRYRDARIIFQDFEPSNWSWDPIAHAYYWHRFFAHQPDLNYANPAVRKAIFKVLDFWLAMGIDGFRLDAVAYLYEREGTSCENLPETHAFLRELRTHIDRRFRDRMLLAEANQWPEDAVTYLAEGKECQMAFHFPLMPRIFIAVRMEDRFPLTDIWAQTPAIDETCQWALFLRNHDELTLETVTDEERDYMFRAYAQESRMRINLGIRRRLAPLLGNNRRTIELVNGLLLSLPGTPVIYYGDEIGMGDNIHLGDRDGVRTPMQWSGDRNAGFSQADAQSLILPVIIDHEYHYQTVNVEAQQRNRHSLLWWMRRLTALRKQFKAFGRGTIEFLHPENPRVLAFIRSYANERILVVANLSRFVQCVELDLARFHGTTPVELFGQTRFPPIGDQPYLLTLGPHMFDWFALEAPADDARAAAIAEYAAPLVELGESWERAMHGAGQERLERALPGYLRQCGWLNGRAGLVRSARIVDLIAVGERHNSACLAIVEVEYGEGEPDTVTLPLALATPQQAAEMSSRTPRAIVAELALPGDNGDGRRVLFDASTDAAFARAILDTIRRGRKLKGRTGELTGLIAGGAGELPGGQIDVAVGRPLTGTHSNSSIAFADQYVVKLMRRIEPGLTPELEVGRFLAASTFANAAPLLGWLEYRAGQEPPRTTALLSRYISNQSDAADYTRGELTRYFERAAVRTPIVTPPAPSLVDLLDLDTPGEAAVHLAGAYLDAARLMGRRVAEMHLALAARSDDPGFAPEPFLPSWQRSVYQSMRNLAGHTLRLLHARQSLLPAAVQARAADLHAHPERILSRFAPFMHQRITAARIRCHGDLHLSQMLYTGTDFVIIDFEGEAERPLSERRRKRAAMRDVAGMLRSFQRVAIDTLNERLHAGALGARDFAAMAPWLELWQTWTTWAFLKEYFALVDAAPFMPRDRVELRIMLDTFMLERMLLELSADLVNRPERSGVPLYGIEQFLGADHDDARG